MEKVKVKPKQLVLYLTEKQKEDVEKKAKLLGMTSNGYVKMLINNDLVK